MPEVSFLREYDAVGNSFPACRENPALETFCEPPTRSLALGICTINEWRMTWIAPLLGATRDAPGMTARLFVRWVRRSASYSGGLVKETGLAPARDGDRLAVRWHPWTTLAGFALIVHFAWEMAQMPLYRMDEPSGWRMVGGCTQATFGDAIITLLAYATAAVLTGRRLCWSHLAHSS